MVGFLQTRFVQLWSTSYLPIQTPYLSATLLLLLHILYRRSDDLHEVFDLVGVGADGMVVFVAASATFAAAECHPVHAVPRR